MKHQLLTANRTTDGAPMYWSAEGRWSLALKDAELFSAKEDGEAALVNARLQEALICDPYLLTVRLIEGALKLPSQREVIRAGGDDVLMERLGYTPGHATNAPTEGAHVHL